MTRTITIRPAICRDCGFVSGLAEVTWPDGQRRTLDVADCEARQGIPEAKAWAVRVAHPGFANPPNPW